MCLNFKLKRFVCRTFTARGFGYLVNILKTANSKSMKIFADKHKDSYMLRLSVEVIVGSINISTRTRQ